MKFFFGFLVGVVAAYYFAQPVDIVIVYKDLPTQLEADYGDFGPSDDYSREKSWE